MSFTTRSNRNRTLIGLITLAGVSTIYGCSSDPATAPPPLPMNNTGGATAGSTATGGVSGSPYVPPVAGTGGSIPAGGTGGAITAGTGGGGTGGASGGTGGGGSGGTGGVYVPPAPYCDGKTHETLPYTVNTGFQLSGWSAGAVTQATTDACVDRPPGAVGGCSYWHITPDVAAGVAFVRWITMWDAGYTHPPVCISEDAAFVTFMAKGDVGGEVVTFAAGDGLQDVEVTLTTEWEQYAIPLDGVMFNSNISGVNEGFVWKIVPTAETPAMDFSIDNIQWVESVDGGGGAGGAGGGGG